MIFFKPHFHPVKNGCNIKVNTVNCVGVMGKGVALEFKKAFPSMFVEYQSRCRARLLNPGDLDIHKALYKHKLITIVNVVTKQHWYNKSQYDWVRQGLLNLRDYLDEHAKVTDCVSLPLPGCGNGGLDPLSVGNMINSILGKQDCDIYVSAL